MEQIKREELYKIQAQRIAKHHREHCEESDCGVMLSILLEIATRQGKLTTRRDARVSVNPGRVSLLHKTAPFPILHYPINNH